jgi:hypothetical protein
MGIKYKVDEAFFENWSDPMAYVLGYWFADGSLEDASYLRGKYIRITSTDEETVKKIKKWLNSEHKIVTLKKDKDHPGKVRYFMRIGNHTLYDSLTRKGLYPNKSLTIKFPPMPDAFLGSFIRGYLDGDGCVFLHKIKGGKKAFSIKRLSVIFTSGSEEFLQGLCATLKVKLDLQQTKIYEGARAFQLRYSTSDSIKIFKFLYEITSDSSFLKRKYEIFENYFTLQPRKVDATIKTILTRLGS